MRSTNRALLTAILMAGLMPAAYADTSTSNTYLKGPVPTFDSVQSEGPFAVTTQTVKGAGFGGGTVYTPNAPGQYALIAVCPGFSAAQSSIAAMSRRLATHGFVVVAIDTFTILDLPGSRGNQLLAALKTVAALQTGPVVGKVDASRMAVAGWSMGGGGTIRAVESTPGLKGGTAWAPFALSNQLSQTAVPLAILAGSADTVAVPSTFAEAFYKAVPKTVPKLLGTIRGANHGFPTTVSQPASYISVAWMKRFVDNDNRYTQFLQGDTRLSNFQSNGPF
ncbi:dienelactone hydrolase family protein [Aquabacterium sp.]|uniref:dienelactone hydrolase family protein n=1 Tax=Aquabacterium sp. TaxID=1872578 RepID=UPI004037AC5F